MKTSYWMILASSAEAKHVIMEIFAISFLVFVVFSIALAIGLLLGRGPIHGRCHPSEDGSCAEKGNCAVRCEKRRLKTTNRESGNVA